MATFSQGFLSALMRPSFSQNLFQVGQGIGQLPALQAQKEKNEQFASMTPIERFNFAIDRLNKTGKYAEAARLTASRDTYIANQQVIADNTITTTMAAQMIANNQTEVPKTLTVGGETIDVPPRLESDILEEVNTLQTRKDARVTSVQSGKLEPFYTDYIKNNPYLLEQDERLSDLYSKVMDPESTMLRPERINAVKSVITAVDSDIARIKGLKTGEKAAKVRVNNLIDAIQARGSKTWFWQGSDMADALEDMEDSEREMFVKQAALYIQQNPKATEQEIIDNGMAGMRKMIPGQKQSAEITASEEALATQREQNIKGIMEARGVSREEAIKIINAIRTEANRRNRLNNF
jgi:hypothetical protein